METDDVELDVEGIDDDDRPSTSSLGLGIDPNELPSVSSHLSPELSQHPWLTFDDQFNPNIPNVILHDDMDESSRATIHQMITEEHSYLQTKKIMRRKNKGLKTLFTPKKTKLHDRTKWTKWTNAEKDLFKKGLEEYGHHWKEISDMMKTRNYTQVKNYARSYFLNQSVKADGQDFSSKCSVKVHESLPTDSLDTDVLPDDEEEEEEEEDIDVEETSDSEQKEQGLQSTVLFGEILKPDDPMDHANDLDSHQDQTATLMQKIEPSESLTPGIDETKSKTGPCMDENIPSYVVGSDGPVLIKTERPSSEDEDALTICLSEQSANPRAPRQRKKGRKGWKGPRKRASASSEEECPQGEGEPSVVPPAVSSVAATQESSLPGNIGSGKSHGQRNEDGMEEKRRKMAMKTTFVKVKEEIEFEGGSEEQDGEGYMEIEVKVEKDHDCMDDLVAPGIKTVFFRNRDYSELCNERPGENLAVDIVVKPEPDVTSCVDTQHALHVDSGQQNDDACCPLDLSLKEPQYRTLPSSNQHVSKDSSSFQPIQIPIPTNAQAINEFEKIPNRNSSQEHQARDRDTISNKGHEGQRSHDDGRTRVGEDGGDDDNGFEEDSEEETIEPPKEEVTLDPERVTDGEKGAHPNFFDYTSSAKTPEKYLAIRNHIVKSWLKIRPNYLNKTSARNGLKNSCDVNLIGAIHRYLETIGAINFGASNPFQQSQRKRRSTVECWAHLQDSDTKINRLESMRPRKQFYRKYSEDIESSGIEKPKKQKSKKPKAPAYDPFKLIECHKFSSVLPAPFTVKVKGDAIVIMDVHSHLSTTEVIGLLGGYYDTEQGVLDIKIARPCRSISTGMQCEMDPVSQTEACEEIQSSGCRVVGWYHSHPTFSPNPSVRDIETQGHFQDWFSQDTKSPFIGVIVSPYHSRQLVTSQINYLTVSQEWSPDHQCWRPYKFDFSVYQDKDVASSHHQLLSTASHLITEFAQYKYRVEMLWVCPGQSGITYLEKMLESISTNLCGEADAKEETISKLKSMVYAQYNNPTVIKDSTLDVTLPFDPSP